MVVQHNLTAMNANRYLGINNNKLSKSLEKLSSGYAINRAGDNAAGLAVSEKMRSQIAGMTQGVKNAQDGISMVQTFEGALTETDSILQRMKTLADQMANGSYDDPVDRAAAQQEFLQLNDELDQIADTDFNGVIVLNGGQMADGLKAVNGKFDYTTGNRVPKNLGKNDVSLVDDSKWNTASNAKNAWADLNASWTRTAGQPDTYGPDSIEVTLQFDATSNAWTTVSASNGADKSKITATTVAGGSETGGFKLEIGGISDAVNVVMDTSGLRTGDTMTLIVNNPATGKEMAANAAVTIADGKDTFHEGTDADNAKKLTDVDDIKVTVGSDAKSATDVTEDINTLLNKLKDAQLIVNYTGEVAAAKDLTLKFSDDEVYAGTTTAHTISVGGSTFHLTFADDAKSVKIGTAADGDEIMEFDLSDVVQTTAADTGKTLSTGQLTFNIGIEHNEYAEGAIPSVEVKSNGKVSISDAFKKSEAKMTYKDSITLQVGARTKDAVNFTFQYNSDAIGSLKADLNCTAKGLGTDKLTIANQEEANYAIDKIDQAINKVSLVRGTFGAIQNRLEHKIDNMNVSIENLTSAESQIRDTDMPTEMMNFTKQQILAQASQSMLAQANQLPQSVLSLLQ